MPMDHPAQSNEPIPESTGAKNCVLHVPDIRTVKVGNVSTTVTENDINEFLSFSGDIHFIESQKQNESSQLFYVTFKESKGADTASLLSGATIGGQSVSITPVDDYQLPPEARAQDLEPQPVAGNAFKTAEDVVSSMLAKGYVLGKDAIGRAKAFDERMKLSSNASATVASIDNKIGLSQKVSIGAAVVNDKVREMDERYQVSGKARSAYMAAEQKASDAGSAILSNRYVAAGATWVSGAISAVSKAAENVTTMTKEKLEKAEEDNKKETLVEEKPEEAQATQPAILPAVPAEDVTTMAKENVEKAEDNKREVEMAAEDNEREMLIKETTNNNLSETQPEVVQAGQPAILPATPTEDVTTEEKVEKADDIKTKSLNKETTDNNLPGTQPEVARAGQPTTLSAVSADVK